MNLKPQISNSKVRIALVLVLQISLTVPALAVPAEGLRQTEASQQQLKSRTQTIAEQIDATVGEFERNGLSSGEEVKTLRAIRGVLGQLSDKQMQQVIDLLQKARSAPDQQQATVNAEQAYTGQQGILAQLKQLLKQYQRQQNFFELARRIEALAVRQDTNLGSAVDVAKATLGKTFQQFDPTQVAAVNVQRVEQEAIRTEISEILQEIRSAAAEIEGDHKQRLDRALENAAKAKVLELATAAVTDLSTGSLYRAATNEKIVRDGLREMARLVAPPETSTEKLRRAAAEVEKHIEEQKKLIAQTQKMPAKKNEVTEAEKQQAKIVDDADRTKKDINDLAPKAAQDIQKAMDAMQEARAKLSQMDPKTAALKEQDALKNLEQAKANLDEQIAKAEQLPEQKDKLAQSKELLEKTKELKKEQEQLAKAASTDPANTTKPQQDLAQKTRDIQQQAADVAPEAAKDLGDAAKQMDRAQQAMQQKQSPQSPQQQAQQELADAEKALAEQVKDLEAAQAKLDQAKDVQQKLGELIQNQQDVERETAKTAHDSQEKKSPAELAKDQKKLQNDAKETAEELKQVQPPGAEEAMQSAQKEMDSAQKQLAKADPKNARPPQREAIKDLQQAKASVDKMVEDLQEQLGQPPDPESEMDAIAGELDEAQQQITEAQQQLEQGADNTEATKKAAQALTNAAKMTAKASAENQGKMAEAAKDSLNKAQEALSDANAQAQAKQHGEAMKNSQEAKQAIAQAQAAMKMQQAGTGPSNQKGQQAQQALPKLQPGQSNDPKQAHVGQEGANPNGDRDDKTGGNKFLGLPARDRAAIVQSQAEKYPQEYAPQVEQYLKNLSDEGK